MKKLAKLLTILTLCLSVVLGTVGCGCGGKTGTRGVLAIASFKAGKADFWLDDMIAAYKEKYPDAKIETRMDALVRDIGVTAYQTNSSEYDIIFIDGLNLGNTVETYGSLYCLNELYNNPATETETETVAEKMRDDLIVDFQYQGDQKKYQDNYYLAPGPSGPTSLIFNCEAMEMVFGENWEEKIPNTTDELIALCNEIKYANKQVNIGGTNRKVQPIMYSKALEYWKYLYLPYIAQYSGIDAWYKMLNCIEGYKDNGDAIYNMELFFPKGKEKALEVLNSLINYNAKFSDSGASGYEFTDAQSYFLQGRACMYVTGDWLENEMAGAVKYNPDLKMVRTPIISAMTDNLSAGIDDAKLSEIVDAVDAGETSLAGVSQEDFDKVKTARSYVYTLANNSISFVPECSVNKDLALQFYRFMYSDEGLQVMLNSNSSMIPCDMKDSYVVPTENLSAFRQSVNEIAFSPLTTYMYSRATAPINYRAGLGFTIQNESPEAFFSQKTPQTVAEYLRKERGILEGGRWADMMVNVG